MYTCDVFIVPRMSLGKGDRSHNRSLNVLRNLRGSDGRRIVPLEFPGRSHEYLTTTNCKYCPGLGLLYDPRHPISLRIELSPIHPELLIPYCSYPSSSSSPIPSTILHPSSPCKSNRVVATIHHNTIATVSLQIPSNMTTHCQSEPPSNYIPPPRFHGLPPVGLSFEGSFCVVRLPNCTVTPSAAKL